MRTNTGAISYVNLERWLKKKKKKKERSQIAYLENTDHWFSFALGFEKKKMFKITNNSFPRRVLSH